MKQLFFLFFLSIRFLAASEETYLTGNNFRTFCDHFIDLDELSLNPSEVKEADTVFVSTPCLALFFKEFHPYILNNYILVSHDDDNPVPGQFGEYLFDSKIIAWFGQNMQKAKHPKLHPLPIGLQNKKWWYVFGDLDLTKKKLSEPAKERTIELYMNFNVNTYPSERTFVYNLFKNKDICYFSNGKNFEQYLDDLLKSKFVLSPRGNGLDCHRTWECLLMGAIPVVKTSDLDPLFEDLPVLIVKHWREITPRFLKKKYSEIILKTYNMDKVYIPYWLNLIEEARQSYLSKKQ